MFVLIGLSLLSIVRSSSGDTGATQRYCQGEYCVTLKEAVITGEAGLCVVIPCSFSTPYWFSPQEMIWFKCESWKSNCPNSETIFHSDKNNPNVQSGFRGRVSLLEPDIRQKNCSIIINDLTESDSGSYQFRFTGLNFYGRQDGLSFSRRAAVEVTALTQKPTLMVPTLVEGQQSTLMCTAPGLCSGSGPDITWSWRGTGENTSYVTTQETEIVNHVTKRHSSALTLNSSAENHGDSVVCEVRFKNGIRAEEAATLNVTYVKVEIMGNTRVTEGETLSLTCRVESFPPPAVITWTTPLDERMPNNNKMLQNNSMHELWEESGMSNYSVANVSASDSGQYICRVTYLNTTLEKTADVEVRYKRKPVIVGNTSLEEGNVLNLTCRVESFPLSHVTWTKLGSSVNPSSEVNTGGQSNEVSATLLIHSVMAEHSGQYTCEAQYLNTTVTVTADVTVTRPPPKISEASRCTVQSKVLTCVCICVGSPLPTIKWPLLRNNTEYSIITTVSRDTVNSTLVLAAKEHSIVAVHCVGASQNPKRKKLTVSRSTSSGGGAWESPPKGLNIPWLEVVIAFLVGVLLSAVVCCLVVKCHRLKQKSFGNLDETLELVASQEDPLMDRTQAAEDNQTFYQEGAGEGREAPDSAVLSHNGEPKDVEYASIDFSALKNRRQAAKQQEAVATEYAEIKRRAKVNVEENGREEDDAPKGKDEKGTETEKETGNGVPAEEKREEESVYSNVEEVLNEI